MVSRFGDSTLAIVARMTDACAYAFHPTPVRIAELAPGCRLERPVYGFIFFFSRSVVNIGIFLVNFGGLGGSWGGVSLEGVLLTSLFRAGLLDYPRLYCQGGKGSDMRTWVRCSLWVFQCWSYFEFFLDTRPASCCRSYIPKCTCLSSRLLFSTFHFCNNSTVHCQYLWIGIPTKLLLSYLDWLVFGLFCWASDFNTFYAF